MKKIMLEIFWQKGCGELIERVSNKLHLMYPGLSIVFKEEKEPSMEAFDSFRQQYDIRYLIEELAGENFSLWIVAVDITDVNFSFLFGGASKRTAVVSTFHSGCDENLLKEACHEVGHLLGLEHCANKCLMRPSKDYFQLVRKELALCQDCRIKIEA